MSLSSIVSNLPAASKKMSGAATAGAAVLAFPDGGQMPIIITKLIVFGAIAISWGLSQASVDKAKAFGAGFDVKTGKPTKPPITVSEGDTSK